MIEAAPADGLTPSVRSKSYCLFTPFCTAPGSLAVPVLFGPAAVLAPEVLASPPGEGLLAPVVMFMVPLPSFMRLPMRLVRHCLGSTHRQWAERSARRLRVKRVQRCRPKPT
jgi:hypothetical protein